MFSAYGSCAWATSNQKRNSMNKKWVKSLVDRYTGYWVYKSRYLPIGADMKLDIVQRIGYAGVETIFDVGANQGQTYVKLRSDFPEAFIHCFEPVGATFEILDARMHGDVRAKASRAAFGAHVGQKTIRLFANADDLNSLRDDLMSTDAGAMEERVEIDTIDNYCRANAIDRIDLLKIDTEGYEMEVLQGAMTGLKAASISFLLCEVGFTMRNTRNTNIHVITEFLAELHYSFYGLYDVSHYWSDRVSFGNALFVHESIVQK